MNSRRAAKVLAVWFICAATWAAWHLLVPGLAENPITRSFAVVHQEDEYFTLCYRKLYLKDMPSAQPESDAPFGVRYWKRDLSKAIVLEHRDGTDGIRVYGRTGNQIQTFFHGFDMARDRGGALVLRETGFPIDHVLQELFLGVGRTVLEEKFGVTIYEHIGEEGRKNITTIPTDVGYHFISKDVRFLLDDLMLHRHYIIQQLYRTTAEDMKQYPNSNGAKAMCSALHALFGDGNKGNMVKELGMKDVTNKYTVIHARTLEGFGPKFMRKASEVFGVDPLAGKEYPPDLVTSILTPLGMHNQSILMITDEKNPSVISQLANDPTVGPYFQVVPEEVSTVTGDMLLAILSEIFIGNPCSTFSQYIAQVRYALGIGNSYIFARRNGDQWETFCSSDEACFYQWQQIWIPLF